MRIESVLIPATRWVVNRPAVAEVLFKLDPWGSPFSDEFLNDPMTMAEPIRRDGPIQHRRLYQQWFFSGYEESREILTSPKAGTEKQGDVLLDVSPYTKMSPRARLFFRNFLLLRDPPVHTRLRSLVNRAFTPRQIDRIDERMNRIVDDLIADFDEHTIEIMGDFATAFPSAVIADLFGLEEPDWPWLRTVSRTMAKLTDPVRSFDPAEMSAVIDEFHDKIVALAKDRRANPRDDLLTGLATAEEEGDRLSEDELVAMAGIILIAGHETTAGMIGLSLIHLSEHRDELAKVRNNPELWPNAVDELLRFDTAVRAIPRTALEDISIGGHTIKAGQNIVVLPQLANRDLRRRADADKLRLDRDDPNPLSFGYGIHYCLGANLAKAELRTALPKLVDALGDFTLDRSKVEWRRSIVLRAPDKLPVTRAS